MVNVVVARPRTIQVSSNSTSGVIDSATPVTIKKDSLVVSNRLDQLLDVNPNGEANNATLVYDSASDTYVVKQIDLDGGFF